MKLSSQPFCYTAPSSESSIVVSGSTQGSHLNKSAASFSLSSNCFVPSSFAPSAQTQMITPPVFQMGRQMQPQRPHQSLQGQYNLSKPRPQVAKTEPVKFKTEMCKNWIEQGFCRYTNKCQFAHGEHELLRTDAPAPPKYKSKDCKSFSEKFFCPYGRRCLFKHDQAPQKRVQIGKYAIQTTLFAGQYVIKAMYEPEEECQINSKHNRLSVFQHAFDTEEEPEYIEVCSVSSISEEGVPAFFSGKISESEDFKIDSFLMEIDSEEETDHSQNEIASPAEYSSTQKTVEWSLRQFDICSEDLFANESECNAANSAF